MLLRYGGGPLGPQDEDGVGRREPSDPAGQRREAGRLEEDAVRRETRGPQGGTHLGDPVDRGERHDHGPPRPPRARRHDRRHVGTAAADENGVGVGQPPEDAGRPAHHRLDVHPVRGGVGPHPRHRLRGLVHGDHGRPEPRALHGHRARPGPDVPHQLTRTRPEPRQRQRPHLELGDHGVPVREVLLGQRPPGGRPRGTGDRHRGRRRDAGPQAQHDTDRVAPVPPGSLPRRDGDHRLAARAEPGRHHEPALKAGTRQGRAQFRGPGAGSGQYGRLRVRPAHVHRGPQVAPVRAHHDRVVPAQPGPGEGDRDGRRRRPYVERRRAEPRAQCPYDPEEAGVAGRQHHHRAALGGVRADHVERGRQRPEHQPPRAGRHIRRVQMAGRADHQVRGADDRRRTARSGADDRDHRVSHGTCAVRVARRDRPAGNRGSAPGGRGATVSPTRTARARPGRACASTAGAP